MNQVVSQSEPSLPVIVINKVKDFPSGNTYVQINVPGHTSAAIAMALRIAAEGIEALGARQFEINHIYTNREPGYFTCRVMVFRPFPAIDKLLTQIGAVTAAMREFADAARREACVRSARHPVAGLTHHVKVYP